MTCLEVDVAGDPRGRVGQPLGIRALVEALIHYVSRNFAGFLRRLPRDALLPKGCWDRFDSSLSRGNLIISSERWYSTVTTGVDYGTHWLVGGSQNRGKVQVFSIITKPMLDSSHHHPPCQFVLRIDRSLNKKDLLFEHHPLNEKTLFSLTLFPILVPVVYRRQTGLRTASSCANWSPFICPSYLSSALGFLYQL